MATFSDSTRVKQVEASGNALYALGPGSPDFVTQHPPGNKAPNAGIYRCAVCGHEIGIAHDHVLPPQDHRHMHNALAHGGRGVKWQLLVSTSQLGT